MRKFISLIAGIGLGALLGVVLVTFFSPVSGAEFRTNVRRHYEESLLVARQARAEKRAELEAELKRLNEGTRS